MSNQLLLAFVVFATVMFFTPGPNNIMLLSSGLTYGFRPTLPHVAGITFGFAFMVGAVGVGLGTVFIAYPVLQTILKYAGVAYLVNFRLLASWGATRTTLVAYVIPVVGIVLGYLVLAEPVDGRLILGTLFVVAGVALVNSPYGRRRLFGRGGAPAPEPKPAEASSG